VSFGLYLINKQTKKTMRTLIATVVGAIILFTFQAASWMALPIHKDSMKYTPKQDSITAMLSKNLKEDGMYFMPNLPPDAPKADHEKLMKSCEGKPYAMINYVSSYKIDMGMPMVIGFIINLISVFLVAMLLLKLSASFPGFGSKLMFVLLYGIIIALQAPLLNWNWMHYPMHYISGEIIDAVLGWLLVGIWLAWYAGRKSAATAA
jgi:hypothetical protein